MLVLATKKYVLQLTVCCNNISTLITAVRHNFAIQIATVTLISKHLPKTNQYNHKSTTFPSLFLNGISHRHKQQLSPVSRKRRKKTYTSLKQITAYYFFLNNTLRCSTVSVNRVFRILAS